MIFERNVKSYREFAVLGKGETCHGICLGMPRHMPWHAKAYALACQSKCRGMHAKAWVRHASQMPPQTTGEGIEGA